MKNYALCFLWNLRGVLASFFSLIGFSSYCLCCGNETLGSVVCESCAQKYLYHFAPLSKRCSLCSRHLISEQDICLLCRKESLFKNLDGVFSLHRYLLWKKDLLFSWKTGDQRLLSCVFAKTLHNALKEIYPRLPIVPVPPRPGKIRKKGWDQIAEVSRLLVCFYGISCIPMLRRLENKQQKKRSRSERLLLMKKGFALSKKGLSLKKIPTAVVLVDDIMTTGATLESCAIVLKSFGVKKVYALTIFYAG